MSASSGREILDKALKRRSELRKESEALDRLIEAYREILGIDQRSEEIDDEQPDLYRGPSKRAMRSAQVADLINEARRIIIAEGRPMKRGELVKRLEAKNFTIHGSDKNKVFGTNLWRSGKFIAVEGKGYWPADLGLLSESQPE